MASRKKNHKVAMIPIKGRPGLFTFEDFQRDRKAEDKVIAQIMKKAKTYRNQLLVKIGL